MSISSSRKQTRNWKTLTGEKTEWNFWSLALLLKDCDSYTKNSYEKKTV